VGGIFVIILYIILQLWAAVKNPTFSSLFQPCQWSYISTSSFWPNHPHIHAWNY